MALLVVLGHLYVYWWPAAYAVFAFYIISGFLMTLIINEHYGFSVRGFKSFWANRFLRLYPAYYAACLVSLLVITLIPEDFVTALNSKLIPPDSPFEIITNISIVGLEQKQNQSSLVPPAWALSIEIVYYFLISIWAGRSKINAIIFLGIGLLYLLAVYSIADSDWWYRYFFVGAASLPFAVGVNIYFQMDRLRRIIRYFTWTGTAVFSVAAYLLCFIAAFLLGHQKTLFFYLNIISSSLLLTVLWNAPKSRLKRIDVFFGDLSYPTYLIHWQVGIAVSYLTGLPWNDRKLVLMSIMIVTIIAAIEARTISGPIERYRKKIKLNVAKKPDRMAMD